MFATHGAYVIDADKIAREVVAAGSPGLARLVAAFGSEIVMPSGDLDRARLAALAFADESSRQQLNGITHPLIQQRTGELFAAAGPGKIIVHDIPLLAELKLAPAYNVVVVVDAPDEVRLDRLLSRGLTREDALARIAAQATREQREEIADIVLDNSGSTSGLQSQVDAAWTQLVERARREGVA